MQGLGSASRGLIVLAAFVVVVAGMQAAKPLLVPFLLSVFLAVIVTPPMLMLRRLGLPDLLAILVVIVGIVLAGLMLGWMIGSSMDDFSNNLANYQKRLVDAGGQFTVWLDHLGFSVDEQQVRKFLNPGKAMALAGDLLAGLGNVIGQAVFILIAVLFILFESTVFKQKMLAISSDPESTAARLENITTSINRYMMIKTSTSLLTGLLVGLSLWIIGVDYPVLWGLVAFLFNYVPNIGSIIAAIPAVLLALIQLGTGAAAWAALAYVLINGLVGNVIEPKYMGKGLGLSPLVVFISLVFWGWVIGPVGMFLSVPLTMTLKIVLESNDESRKIALLLGDRA